MTALPVAGVSRMPDIVALNERVDKFSGGAGGVAVRVRLSVAVPLPPGTPPVLGGPLQLTRIGARRNRITREKGLRFVEPPAELAITLISRWVS